MTNVEVIKEFEGEYFFLSNFFEADFEWRGQIWHSGEQAFQYCKTYAAETMAEMNKYQALLREPDISPGLSKHYGRKIRLDLPAWESRKVSDMREIVHAKFSTVPGLAGKLLNTGAAMLVEGNTWNDTYWGRCGGKGKNVLGAILIEERGYWLHSNFALTERTAHGMMGS